MSSLVLFVTFFLGVFALFQEDLGPWQEPRMRHAAQAAQTRTLELVQGEVNRQVDLAPARLDIQLPDEHTPWILVAARGRDGDPRFEWIDPETGDRVPPRSDLGFFLYLMHFLWPIPGGDYVAGVAAVILLFILISGVVIHLNKLWQELALFRPNLRLRLVWSDAHKVLGVIGLPFQIVIAWTGALLCLQSTVGPFFVQTTLGGDRGALDHALSLGPSVRPAGEPGEPPDVRLILARAEEALPRARHRQLIFRNLGDRSAFVDVRGEHEDGLLRQTSVRISARDGGVLFARGPGGDSRYSRSTEAFYALHLASYGGFGLRVAYALLALFGALGIVTGVLVWIERRMGRGLQTGDILLARLTAGGCAGTCLAVAALFVANQLLPNDLQERPVPTAALFQRDLHGRPLLAAYVDRSGLSLERWLSMLFDRVAVPLYHLLCRHGIGVVAHGQNIGLILDEHRPHGMVLKDFHGDVRLVDQEFEELETLPCSAAGALTRLPARHLVHDLFTGHFVTVLRFVSSVAERAMGLPERAFYALLARALRGYQDAHPELRGRFSAFDLFRTEVERICINRARLRLGYADSDERPLPDLGASLANPLAMAE